MHRVASQLFSFRFFLTLYFSDLHTSFLGEPHEVTELVGIFPMRLGQKRFKTPVSHWARHKEWRFARIRSEWSDSWMQSAFTHKMEAGVLDLPPLVNGDLGQA